MDDPVLKFFITVLLCAFGFGVGVPVGAIIVLSAVDLCRFVRWLIVGVYCPKCGQRKHA